MLKLHRTLVITAVAVVTTASLSACGSNGGTSGPAHDASSTPAPSSAQHVAKPEKATVNKGAVTKVLKKGQHLDLGAVDGFKHLYIQLDSITTTPSCTTPLPTSRYGRYVAVTLTMQGVRANGKKAQSPMLIGNWVSTGTRGEKSAADWSGTMSCLSENAMFPTTLDKNDLAHGTLVFDVPTDTKSLTEQFTYAKPPANVSIAVPGVKG